MPGFPASHGCVGLYEWAIGDRVDNGRFTLLKNGPKVRIVGKPQL